MARSIASGRLAYCQADFFESGSRKTGVQYVDIQARVFVDGIVLPWAMSDGTFVPDSSVAAGSVFFNEVAGASGFYSVRFFPDRPGFWRIVISHPVLGVEIIIEFDTVPPMLTTSGLLASFT